MATCPSCGSNSVSVQLVETGAKTKKYGNGLSGKLHNANRKLLGLSTFGISNLFIKKSRGIEKTKIRSERIFVCQNCGKIFSGFTGNLMALSAKKQSSNPATLSTQMTQKEDFNPEDPTVQKAVAEMIKRKKYSTAFMQGFLFKGHSYTSQLGRWLEENGFVGPLDKKGNREVLLEDIEDFRKATGSIGIKERFNINPEEYNTVINQAIEDGFFSPSKFSTQFGISQEKLVKLGEWLGIIGVAEKTDDPKKARKILISNISELDQSTNH